MPLRTAYVLSGAALLVLVTMVVDFNIPSGSLHSVSYVVLISLSFWLSWSGAPFALALLSTLLVMAQHYYAAADAGTDLIWYNILTEAAVLWVAAILVRAFVRSVRSLEEREEQLKVLIETAVDSVIIIDAQGRVEEYNLACKRLFGYPRQEVIGNNVKMLMPSPYREEHDRYLRRYCIKG